jgi:hypothetical protein
MQLIGKDTEPKLNFPLKITLPIYFTTSLNAVLYLPNTSGSLSAKPPSFHASG